MLYNSFNQQVNPRWTKQDIETAKAGRILRKRAELLKHIDNCNWFINHPQASTNQIAEFTADRAKFEKQLKDLK